jgi:hypothetical protein
MTPFTPEDYDRLIAPRTLATAGGTYVTDGRRLFRVVSPLAAPPDLEVAELEDCMTLETDSYSPGELWAMRLVLVKRGAADVVADPVAVPVPA